MYLVGPKIHHRYKNLRLLQLSHYLGHQLNHKYSKYFDHRFNQNRFSSFGASCGYTQKRSQQQHTSRYICLKPQGLREPQNERFNSLHRVLYKCNSLSINIVCEKVTVFT